MKSQNYENTDGDPAINRVLSDADARIAQLALDRAAIAERRRALVEPAYRTVVANPTDMHHKITLGAVMVNAGLTASDADALAGLLASGADQIMADAEHMTDSGPFTSFGRVLINLIDRHDRDLSARGMFETWCRRLAAYQEDRAEWLARDEEYRLAGAWRDLGMTTGQRWLVRVTCRIRNIDLPGHLSRGDAADWLDTHGANLNYREFVL